MRSPLLVEGLGTFFLVLVIGLVALPPGAGPLAPLAVGAILLALIRAGAPASGAHFNPAVSLAFWFVGSVRFRAFLAYALIQLLAAGGAALVVFLAAPDAQPWPGPPLDLRLPVVALAEGLFTCALVWVILSVALVARGPGGEVAIAAVVTAGAFAVGPLSHAAFNPAVTVALAAWGVLPVSMLPLYLGAQLLGAVGAVLAHRQCFPRPASVT